MAQGEAKHRRQSLFMILRPNHVHDVTGSRICLGIPKRLKHKIPKGLPSDGHKEQRITIPRVFYKPPPQVLRRTQVRGTGACLQRHNRRHRSSIKVPVQMKFEILRRSGSTRRLADEIADSHHTAPSEAVSVRSVRSLICHYAKRSREVGNDLLSRKLCQRPKHTLAVIRWRDHYVQGPRDPRILLGRRDHMKSIAANKCSVFRYRECQFAWERCRKKLPAIVIFVDAPHV